MQNHAKKILPAAGSIFLFFCDVDEEWRGDTYR